MTSRMRLPKSACYEQLGAQEIRLASIVPSSLDSAVRVRLETVPHASVRGRYCCLSYAWGNTRDRMPIMINEARYLVGCNLYSLLRRLRGSKRNENVWIDAICINQDNAEEKAMQVAIMSVEGVTSDRFNGPNNLRRSSIYSEAAKVLIGLDDSRTYIIKDIPTQHALAAATLRGLADDAHLYNLEYFSQASQSKNSSHEISSSFGQVLDSRWFGRTWVVQEKCLAKKATLLFPWGDMDWEVFHAAFVNWNKHSRTCCEAFSETLGDALSDACHRMYLHVRSIAYTRNRLANGKQHITEAMLNYQHLEVTDHRDKIYAFRGLHTDSNALLPKPDYSHTSMGSTFRDFAIWHLEDKQSLQFLGLDSCFGNVAELTGLPSWVPTWPTIDIERGNIAKARAKFLQCYSAAPGFRMDYRWLSCDPARLQLNGVKLDDQIVAVTETSFTGKETFPERVALMKKWYHEVAFPDQGSGQISPQHMHHAFCVTILGGIINEPGIGGPRLITVDDDDDAAAIQELKNVLSDMEQNSTWNPCNPLQITLLHTQDVALLDRIMFRTCSGRIGLGPCTMRFGDEIFLLRGGNAPFLLRPDANGTCRLMGHGYVHGIMNADSDVEVGGSSWVDLI